MKTTVEIADPLFEAARRLADRQGTTMRALMERGLQEVLRIDQMDGAAPFRLRDASFKGGSGLRPDMAEAGWETIRAAAYEADADRS